MKVTREPAKHAKKPSIASSQQLACTHKEHKILSTVEATAFAAHFTVSGISVIWMTKPFCDFPSYFRGSKFFLMHGLCLSWTPTRHETMHKTSGGGLLPLGDPFFNISLAEHGHTGLLQVPAHVLPIFNINQSSETK